MKYKNKYFWSALLCLILVISITAAVFANSSIGLFSRSEKPDAGRFTVSSDIMLRQQAGMNWKQWDEMCELQQKNGLSDPLTRQKIEEADPEAVWSEKDETVNMISGKLPLSASDAMQALYTAYRLLPVLNARQDAQLRFISQINMNEYKVYMMQETFEGFCVPGSTVRVVTDEEGNVCAVLNSLMTEAPVSAGIRLIDAQEAEKCVMNYLHTSDLKEKILSEYTEQVVMPQDEEEEDAEAAEENAEETVENTEETEEKDKAEEILTPDMHIPEDIYPDMLQWVVYTENDNGFNAHYVSADGTWLNSIEIRKPGDEAGRSGKTDIYIFDNLEPDVWTGEVTGWDGKVHSLTVPVMKDTETGTYYLGDSERKILFADFYEYAYNEDNLMPVTSEDNSDWRHDDLLTYENFIKVWDMYAEMGWTGPDGEGTPVLLLRDMCSEDQTPLENAAYIAKYGGWQIFGYDNSSISLGEAFDVMAHEFTHGVTFTAQGMNLYSNDIGAINESLSDIMGSLMETKNEESHDADWLMGEDSGMTMRSMINPHEYNQPEYVWDVFYTPSAKTPNDTNDRGGVHSNSSILNLLAAKMMERTNMDAEDAMRFWMTVICTMTPGTDLVQMSDILKWSVNASGFSRYERILEEEIELRKLTRTQIPDTLPKGQKLVTLMLPDNEAMTDQFWILQGLQLNKDKIPDLLGLLLQLMFTETDSSEDDMTSDFVTGNLIKTYSSWVSDDSNSMNMIIDDQTTIYLLMNLDPETMEFHGMAALLGDRWIDLESLVADMDADPEADPEQAMESLVENLLNSGLEIGMQLLSSLIPGLGGDTSDADGSHIMLPTEGLDQIQLVFEE